MAKDKKKKGKKSNSGKSGKNKKTTVSQRLKAITDNPAMAEFVAAALVATAAALKDKDKARRLASEVGDELTDLAKHGANRGHALWEMALQIGRRSLESIADGKPLAKVISVKATPAKRAPAKRTSAKRTVAKPAAKPAAVKRTTVKKTAVRRAPRKRTAPAKPA